MRSGILTAVLASLSVGACSMADEVVAPPEPTLSIVLPQSREERVDPTGAGWRGLAAVRVDGGLLQKVEEGYPEVTYWDVIASIAPGSASVQGFMRYSGNRGTMTLSMRLWKGPDPLLSEPSINGSQGGGIYPPLPFGLYSFDLAHTINLPSELQCGITNSAGGRFQAFFDLPAIPNVLQSEVQQDWDDASLPPCTVTKPYEGGGTGGGVHYVKVCYVLDHYDITGEYSYTEEVQCWVVAYTSGNEPPQWEI